MKQSNIRPPGPGPKQQKAFDELKTVLLKAPALALPDPLKSFTLFVDERKGIAKGVLMQQLGPWKRPVAYLSKKLDPVAAEWPPCLRIIAAVALMVKDADKLTFGQHLKVVTPHAIEGVLKHPPDLEVPLHECQEILAELTQVHPDLQDVALPNSELVWYTGGSSFIMDGMRRAGMAVVDQDGNVIWSASLPLGTSAQKAELIALAEALE
ncbi:uncharacterized protein LOC130684076 isoform X2 [Manis pentadactyla]|uniref:uncharacterized protein LOC130684076 isoform X2 n=1 Tax=Manis pentadactyla TaxID=143292 RepID=UPI00255CB193|nr:uncharacterized protein LOC130684076 isoform X2 [Manis pentadactyla]